MATRLTSFFDVDRDSYRTFVQRGRGAVPGKRPTPIHAHFIMRIDDVFHAELVTKYLAPVLIKTHDKVLALVGPVSVANPQHILTRAWHFNVLIDSCFCFVCTRGRRVPLTLTSLRPFGRHSRAIDTSARSFCARQVEPRGVQHWFAELTGGEAMHVFGFIPEVFVTFFCLWGKSCSCEL